MYIMMAVDMRRKKEGWYMQLAPWIVRGPLIGSGPEVIMSF